MAIPPNWFRCDRRQDLHCRSSPPELTSGRWEVLCQATEEPDVLRDWPKSPGPLLAQTSSRMMNNQALGWKGLQQRPLHLSPYASSNLVRIPEGQRKLFVGGRQLLVFPGLPGVSLHVFLSAERF